VPDGGSLPAGDDVRDMPNLPDVPRGGGMPNRRGVRDVPNLS